MKSFQITIALAAFSAAFELGTGNFEHSADLVLAEVDASIEATIGAEIELEAECGHCGCGCGCHHHHGCCSCDSSSSSSSSSDECPLYDVERCNIGDWC